MKRLTTKGFPKTTDINETANANQGNLKELIEELEATETTIKTITNELENLESWLNDVNIIKKSAQRNLPVRNFVLVKE